MVSRLVAPGFLIVAAAEEVEQPPALSYALWDIGSLGLPDETVASLRDMLRGELHKVLGHRLVRVEPWVDAEMRHQINACGGTTECIVEVGGGLGADRVIVGVAAALGRNYSLNLKIEMGYLCSGEPSVCTPGLLSLVVAPLEVTLPAGGIIALSAIGAYADGSVQDVTARVTWRSSDSTVVAVSNETDSEGQIAAMQAGAITVTATLSGREATTNVTVVGLTPEAILVDPAVATIAVGQQQYPGSDHPSHLGVE